MSRSRVKTQMVHLGFEVGAAAQVLIPVGHMIVTGMTQQAGKTTTLEALIDRSRLRAVTFVTKRGEGAFKNGHRMQPFFRERADWVFVASLIDATLGEKNKMLRSWLMRVCRNTTTLAQVQENVRYAKGKAKGFSESIYTEIEGYLDLVVPQLSQLPPARAVNIESGLNVMDLSAYSTELQALVIKSVLEHVFEHEREVVTVIPEAWEFLPEGRGSPVKREAESLIRKGAGLHNFVWLDSQDLAGVWKTAVRACPVALIGVQREANEVKRTLANIPGGIAKPKPQDIATLERGEFYACWGQHAIKTYVQPTWMSAEFAKGIAAGELPADLAPEPETPEEEEPMSKTTDERLDRLTDVLEQFVSRGQAAQRDVDRIVANKSTPDNPEYRSARADIAEGTDAVVQLQTIYNYVKERLAREAPALLKVLQIEPEIEIKVTREVVEVDLTSTRGMMALLLHEGFMDKPIKSQAVWHELKRRWNFKGIAARAHEQLEWLASRSFLTKEADGYKAVPAMRKNVRVRS